MKRKQQRMVIGIALIVAGIGLLMWGYNISGSWSGRLSSALTGSPGDKATILYILGAVCTALGIFQLAK